MYVYISIHMCDLSVCMHMCVCVYIGSMGQHFRVLGEGADSLRPNISNIAQAEQALERFQWVGVTDLYEPSLCLLHYMANGLDILILHIHIRII